MRERSGHRDHLLLRRPQRRDRRRRRDALIPEPGEQRFGFAVHRCPVQQRTTFVFVAQKHVLRDRQVRNQVELLVDGGDAAGDRRVRIPDRQRLAFEPNLASGRLNQPGNALDERRLAGTVLANEAMHLAAGHRQVDAAQGTHARIVLDQPTNLQQGTGSVGHPHLR